MKNRLMKAFENYIIQKQESQNIIWGNIQKSTSKRKRDFFSRENQLHHAKNNLVLDGLKHNFEKRSAPSHNLVHKSMRNCCD